METNQTIDITAASDIDLMELLYADTIATKAGRRAAVYAMDLDPSIALLDWIDGGAEDAVESFLMGTIGYGADSLAIQVVLLEPEVFGQ